MTIKRLSWLSLFVPLLGFTLPAISSHPDGSLPAIDTICIETTRIKTPAKVVVALPDGYYTSTRRFPVTYLLNGYSGSHRDWDRAFDLDSLATASDMILICVDGRNSWYWDSPVDSASQMESYIVEDLIPAIDTRYRTIADSAHRAVTGLSMGGQGAFWLGIRHPSIFHNVGSMSGAVDMSRFPGRWASAKVLDPKKNHPRRWHDHSVQTLVEEQLKPGKINIIFDCGTSDIFYNVNCRLDSTLSAKGISHTFSSRPGNHDWSYWKQSLPQHLRYFKTQFRKSDSK